MHKPLLTTYTNIMIRNQYGAPSSEDGYIHRLGRTGRAGQQGKGLLVLMPFERESLATARRRGIQEDLEMFGILEDSGRNSASELIEPTLARIRSGHNVLTPNAEAAYRAFLAYYIGNSGALDPSKVLTYASDFAFCSGLPELPAIESKVASRLGLEGLVDEK